MGVRQTTQMREALKEANPSAKWATTVNLMPPDQVEIEYHKLMSTSQLKKESTE